MVVGEVTIDWSVSAAAARTSDELIFGLRRPKDARQRMARLERARRSVRRSRTVLIDDAMSASLLRMRIACADCGCVVDRGVRLALCADDRCCCSRLPVIDACDEIGQGSSGASSP